MNFVIFINVYFRLSLLFRSAHIFTLENVRKKMSETLRTSFSFLFFLKRNDYMNKDFFWNGLYFNYTVSHAICIISSSCTRSSVHSILRSFCFVHLILCNHMPPRIDEKCYVRCNGKVFSVMPRLVVGLRVSICYWYF